MAAENKAGDSSFHPWSCNTGLLLSGDVAPSCAHWVGVCRESLGIIFYPHRVLCLSWCCSFIFRKLFCHSIILVSSELLMYNLYCVFHDKVASSIKSVSLGRMYYEESHFYVSNSQNTLKSSSCRPSFSFSQWVGGLKLLQASKLGECTCLEKQNFILKQGEEQSSKGEEAILMDSGICEFSNIRNALTQLSPVTFMTSQFPNQDPVLGVGRLDRVKNSTLWSSTILIKSWIWSYVCSAFQF